MTTYDEFFDLNSVMNTMTVDSDPQVVSDTYNSWLAGLIDLDYSTININLADITTYDEFFAQFDCLTILEMTADTQAEADAAEAQLQALTAIEERFFDFSDASDNSDNSDNSDPAPENDVSEDVISPEEMTLDVVFDPTSVKFREIKHVGLMDMYHLEV